MKTLILFLAFVFLGVDETIWVHRGTHEQLEARLAREKLLVRSVRVVQVHRYGEKPGTLLIWECYSSKDRVVTFYHYCPVMHNQEVLLLRKVMIGSGHPYFPILFAR